MSMSFSNSESCTFDDLKKRNEKCKLSRGWKVPITFLNSDVVEKIEGYYPYFLIASIINLPIAVMIKYYRGHVWQHFSFHSRG